MPQSPTLQPRRKRLVQSVDDALKQALAPILVEELPVGLRVVLEALYQEGSADDPDENRPR